MVSAGKTRQKAGLELTVGCAVGAVSFCLEPGPGGEGPGTSFLESENQVGEVVWGTECTLVCLHVKVCYLQALDSLARDGLSWVSKDWTPEHQEDRK